MPYPSTYGRREYPFQSTELPPEEQARVPMLTNIPETADKAAGMGQDVYFLSDRPETEQFLAEKTPARPYKKVVRDVRAMKPSEEDLTGMEAWKEFKEGYLSKQPGYYDPDEINPPVQGQKARQTYLEGFFRGKSKAEIDNLDPGVVNKLYKEADRLAKAEEAKALWTRRNGLEIKNKFLADWKEKQREIRAAQKPEREGQAIPAVNPDTNETQWYFPQTKTWGPLVAAKPAPEKPEKPAKKVSYVGWDKTGKETVERVDVDDTDSQSDLIGKGYVEKSKFDRMDMLDRKLAQREAMKRIGGGIPLDRATAAKFLKEAGGDKEKARKLARDKGYIF